MGVNKFWGYKCLGVEFFQWLKFVEDQIKFVGGQHLLGDNNFQGANKIWRPKIVGGKTFWGFTKFGGSKFVGVNIFWG